MSTIEWSFHHGVAGLYPTHSHTSAPFTDPARRDKGGKALGVYLACCHLRGDWLAYVELAGMRGHGHNTFPCPCCNVRKADMFNSDGNFSLGRLGATPYTQAEYDADVPRQTRVITIDSLAKRSLIFRNLKYQSKKPHFGRVLANNLPELGLCVGDRLEPSEELRDIAQFEITVPPFVVRFFRLGFGDRLTNVSPLLRIPGINVGSYAVDILHAWHLGGLPVCISASLWMLIKSGIYAPAIPGMHTEDLHKLSIVNLRGKLWGYYKRRRQHDPLWKKTGSQAHHKNQ